MKKSILSMLVLSSILSAQSLTFTEYVNVRSSQPQYERLVERVPYQECRDERVRVDSSYDNRYNNNTNSENRVAASVLGGTLGGVIGHQIGKGKGNDVATIGGAILGTIVGGNMAQPNQSSQSQRVYQEPRYEIRRNCTTKYRESRARNRLTGYKNIAYYKGKKIVKYSSDRLSTIPVTITIDY